jgi:hypothetical protein
VKRQIEESQGKEAFPCHQQLLIHQGKVLKDDTTMTDNRVSENGFLVVMLTKVLHYNPWYLHCISKNSRVVVSFVIYNKHLVLCSLLLCILVIASSH